MSKILLCLELNSAQREHACHIYVTRCILIRGTRCNRDHIGPVGVEPRKREARLTRVPLCAAPGELEAQRCNT